MPVIDAHTHLVPGSPVFDEWAKHAGTENSRGALLAEMAACDVDRAIVIGHWVEAEGKQGGPFTNGPNNDLFELMRDHGDRFRALLGVNIAADGARDVDALDEHLADPRFAGVKFFTGYETYHADDPRCEPVLEALERRGKVAMFHTGDTLLPSGHVRYAHPVPIDEVAVRHPRLRIVIAHAGQHWMPDAGEVVGKNPNVWADISGWFIGKGLGPHAPFLRQQFRALVYWACGCERLMFGSDWPLMRVRPYLDFLEGCRDFLTPSELEGIRYANAKRLYWPD